MIAVGCSNGDLAVVDGKGITRMIGHVDSSVAKILMKTNDIYVGSDNGTIYKYTLGLN